MYEIDFYFKGVKYEELFVCSSCITFTYGMYR